MTAWPGATWAIGRSSRVKRATPLCEGLAYRTRETARWANAHLGNRRAGRGSACHVGPGCLRCGAGHRHHLRPGERRAGVAGGSGHLLVQCGRHEPGVRVLDRQLLVPSLHQPEDVITAEFNGHLFQVRAVNAGEKTRRPRCGSGTSATCPARTPARRTRRPRPSTSPTRPSSATPRRSCSAPRLPTTTEDREVQGAQTQPGGEEQGRQEGMEAALAKEAAVC